jgi:hypothetical protein
VQTVGQAAGQFAFADHVGHTLQLVPLTFRERTPLAMRGVTVAQLRLFARCYPGSDSRSMQKRLLEGVPGVRGGSGCTDGLSYARSGTRVRARSCRARSCRTRGSFRGRCEEHRVGA